jgi:hypothetical protein
MACRGGKPYDAAVALTAEEETELLTPIVVARSVMRPKALPL